MISTIQAKTILSTLKKGADTWFGLRYNMNLYRGCQHGCIYCDSRSTCYQLGELSDIRMKENALQLLEKEIKSKREKGTIGFGSMNDCYMPVEQNMELTRKALQIIQKYRFPIHIITKSSLVTRDIDILREISKTYAAVSITITAFDDQLSKIIEPRAPVSSERFKALQQLSNEGIYCGITLMPILPFITDSKENITAIIEKAKKVGAKYSTAAIGVTMREGNREYYYQQLDKYFPNLKEKYIETYGNQYNCTPANYHELYNHYRQVCRDYDLSTRMKFYEPPKINQLQLF